MSGAAEPALSAAKGQRDRTRGAILAGGGATRFGGKPKGLEIVGGERILDRLVAAMTSAIGEPPLLVANAPHAERWRPDLRTIPDVRPGLGALGGIYTAVVEAPAPVVCVAWDMPFVSEALIQALAAGLEQHDAVLPESGGRRGMEPLCAAYGSACRDAIADSLTAGDLRAIGFHDRIRVGILPLAEVRALADPELVFFNVNTADDLAKADQLWRQHVSSR
jgi:molybdopterin-guanine dinucleotide biosynthesis protein A